MQDEYTTREHDQSSGRRSGAAQDPTPLGEIALLFLRLGATAFGGPAAHVALMHEEVVKRRKWLSEERFLDLVGATNLIPGPNSTELAIHIGFARRGLLGLAIAGSCFIVPAMLVTWGFGWAYVEYGTLPQTSWLLYGVKPVMIAIVVQALVALAPKAARSWSLRALGLGAALALALGGHELAVLFGSGALLVLARSLARRGSKTGSAPLFAFLPAAALSGAATPVTLPHLFWIFLKTGSVLFGSGYVLIAFLRADLVERLGLLTEAQLVDAIAVGQVTPGPVFTTATFIGYLLSGTTGALVATLGIFLPAFVFVALSAPLLPRLRASQSAGAFLDGVNVASLSLMAVVTLELAGAALVDAPTILLAVVAAAVLLRFKLNPTWLVLGGAFAGLLLHALRA